MGGGDGVRCYECQLEQVYSKELHILGSCDRAFRTEPEILSSTSAADGESVSMLVGDSGGIPEA